MIGNWPLKYAPTSFSTSTKQIFVSLQVVPADNSDYLEPLSSPERSSAKRNSRTKQPSRRKTLSRFPVEIINLSTITEESFHSHGSSSSIAVEINPTIVVQSTSSSRNSTPSDSSVASDSDESDLYNVQKPCCNCSANKVRSIRFHESSFTLFSEFLI